MSVFGRHAFGFRMPSIVFGIAAIFIFYLICRTLVRRGLPTLAEAGRAGTWNYWFQPVVFVPLLATFLFAVDPLSFDLAHIGMLDVFSVTLMLLGFLFYLRGRQQPLGGRRVYYYGDRYRHAWQRQENC